MTRAARLTMLKKVETNQVVRVSHHFFEKKNNNNTKEALTTIAWNPLVDFFYYTYKIEKKKSNLKLPNKQKN